MSGDLPLTVGITADAGDLAMVKCVTPCNIDLV